MSDWDDEDQQDSDLVKNLRKQITELGKKNSELTNEVGTLRPQVRKTSVAEILNGLGVNSKIAALVPSDVEASKDAIESWLKEYGDVFGVTKVEAVKTEEEKPEEPEQLAGQKPLTVAQVVDPGTQLSWSRIQSAEAGAGSTTQDIEQQQLAQLGAAAAASGDNLELFTSYLRGEKALP